MIIPFPKFNVVFARGFSLLTFIRPAFSFSASLSTPFSLTTFPFASTCLLQFFIAITCPNLNVRLFCNFLSNYYFTLFNSSYNSRNYSELDFDVISRNLTFFSLKLVIPSAVDNWTRSDSNLCAFNLVKYVLTRYRC